MTNDELKKYYTDLLIRQYHELPKARGTIDALGKEAIAEQIISQVRDAFDLDTAVGNQLDILGKYVGINRTINGLDIAREYFALIPYDDVSPEVYYGFSLYGVTPTSQFRLYSDENTAYRMTDDEMRRLIKLRIRQQTSNHSLADIDDIVDEFFGDDCLVTDDGDMVLTYAFTPGLTDTLPAIAAFTNSLPKPAGVEIITTGI
jgi:hypothetical protein